MVQLVTRGFLVNQTFIGGSYTMTLMNRHSDQMSVASSGNYINSVVRGLVGVTFASCILECNK